ncbi:MAG: HEPN domain-containing protein [Proteobacteria bacterium]|nr:HEPN domain-containing protein [Pseudomonadota bacterium]
MTDHSFSVSLVRKSERAIQIARLSLENEDPDSAVNRAYYAMFNISRAALLNAGIPEGDLPRTHRGISEAFRQHAVLTGKVDAELASALSRAESLRLMADYTATEIDAHAATKLVEQAENYVRTVERVFGLQQSAGVETVGPGEIQGEHSRDEQGAATGNLTGTDEMEEARRKGREEWLKLQKQKLESGEPTLEQKRAKAVEDWLSLRRQQNRPIKDREERRSAADLGRGEQAKGSGKGSEDDLDP